MSAFDEIYTPTEEHEAFRAAVREVCDAKVAPHAAAADETGEFPKASYEALRAADFHAPHIPGGVRRRRRRRAGHGDRDRGGRPRLRLLLADPGGQQARHDAAAAGRRPTSSSSATCRRWPRGEAMFSYCLSEPEAGSDAVEHDDPGRPRRRRLGAQRRQALDHQRRRLRLLHGLRGHRPGRRAPRASAPSWSRGPTTGCPSARRRRSSASRARRPARSTSTTCGSRATG